MSDGPLHLPRGFRWASGKAGLKASGNPDLAIAIADERATAAALFTRNRVVAAPVIVGRDHLKQSGGRVHAVLVNSGNANCATGPVGLKTCHATCDALAKTLGIPAKEVFPSSTGIIGVPLPGEKIRSALPQVLSTAAAGEEALRAYAQAIMTTDTRPKIASARCTIAGKTVSLVGVAKGAGMIHPNMATMLSVITTDAAVEPARLDRALRAAVEQSFNRISVDGDMSTNDTVLLLASGGSFGALDGPGFAAFTDSLTEACVSLARQIARDGEGATRLVEILVSGARDEGEAHRVADSIARSPLVKTAIHGGDPNWGRILAAAGYSGAEIDPERLSLEFGDSGAPLALVRNGLPLPHDRDAASALLRRDPVMVHLDLGLGDAGSTVWTCDFSAEYVAINAHYTT